MALIVLVVTFSFINPNYGTLKNFNNVLIAASLTGLIAVGESSSYWRETGSFSWLNSRISGVLASLLMAKGISAPIAIALCLLMGACIGAFNAFFTTFFKISPFIVTLASQSIVRGMCYIVSNGEVFLSETKAFCA
jgi:ribose/xylose/arabinose/galactoside ABC-type transport system permease subunit